MKFIAIFFAAIVTFQVISAQTATMSPLQSIVQSYIETQQAIQLQIFKMIVNQDQVALMTPTLYQAIQKAYQNTPAAQTQNLSELQALTAKLKAEKDKKSS